MQKPFTVSEDGENFLELCLPLRQQIKAITKGDTVTFDQQIVGRDGENVYVYTPRGSAPASSTLSLSTSLPPPSFTVLDSDGNEVGKGAFEAG